MRHDRLSFDQRVHALSPPHPGVLDCELVIHEKKRNGRWTTKHYPFYSVDRDCAILVYGDEGLAALFAASLAHQLRYRA